MVKNKRFFALALTALCFVVTLTLAVVFNFKNNPITEVQAATVELESELNEQYDYGTVLTIPNGQVVHNGKKYDAEFVVKFPDGKVYSQRTVELVKSGKYTVEYSAQVDGVYVYSHKFFTVSNRLYSFKDDNSYAYYGAHEKYSELPNGVIVSLAQSDKFQFNAPIDLTNATRSDELVKLYFTPKTVGAAEVTTLNVRLVDENNPNNYVTMKIKKSSDEWGYMMSYVTVNATEQLPVGRMEKANGNVNIYKNNQYGTSVVLSFTARKVTNGAVISFDSQTKQFFINGYLVADLDDFEYVDTLWNGFSTGRAYLSIWSENYAADALNMLIANVGGYDLSQGVYEGITAPEVTVDLEGYQSNALPKAIVGESYRIFNAKAFDKLDGNMPVNVSVWYNYQSENRARVNVVDNSFLATAEGVYSIVYEATNSFGKQTKVVLNVVSVNLQDATCDLVNFNSSAMAGNNLKVCDAISFENVVGSYDVSMKAKLNGRDVEYVINTTDFTFKPLYAGVYTIEVTVKDHVRTTVFEREVTVSANNITTFEESELDLPDFFIKNINYILPEVKAYDLSSGEPVAKNVEIFVKEDNGSAVKLSSNEYKSLANSSVLVTYTIAGTTTSLSKTVKVVDVGYGGSISFDKYFSASIGTVSSTKYSDTVKLKFNKNTSVDGQAEVEYINPIRWNKFTARFGFDAGEYNAGEFYVRLNDQIEFAFKKLESGYLQISINGTQNYAVASLFDEFITDFELSYDDFTKTINVDNTFKFIVASALGNAAFDGFNQENGISLKIGCRDIKTDSSLKVYSINECVFSDFDEDLTGPYVYFDRISGARSLNEVVTLTPAFAFDMFSPVYNLKMYVSKAGVGYITALDGTVLDGTQDPNKTYQIKLSDYGSYVVTYSVVDALNNPSRYSYSINVVDEEKPVLQLETGTVLGKVNEAITLRNATVTDNVDSQLEIIVNIEKPDGTLERIKTDANGNKTFTPAVAGTYNVYYIVSDTEGNTTIAQYSIVVK